jgi:type I restriction enzyme S subunit
MKPWSEVPTGWEETTLDELGAEVRSGFASGKHNQEGRGIPHLRPMNVSRSGEIDLADVKYVEPSDDRRLSPGDVLFNNTNSPALVGKTAHFTRAGEYAFSNHMTRVRPPAKLDSRFLAHQLHYLWMSGYFQRICRNHVNQASVASRTLARDVGVLVAPLEEQQRTVEAIEEHFSRLDAAVESLQHAKRNLAGLRVAVLKAAVEGLPTAPLAHRLREPLRNGKSAKRSAGGRVRVLTLSAVTDRDFSEYNTKMVDLDPDDLNDLWIEPGDVFVERSNTPELVGSAALYRGGPRWAIFPDLLIRVRVDDALDPRFLELCLQSPPLRQYFRSRAKGIAGSMPKIDQEVVAAAPVPDCSLDRQHEVVAEVEHQLSIVAGNERTIEQALKRSVALRRSILGAAFAGHLARVAS